MKYTKSLLIYQDRPAYGFLLKLIIMAVPLASLAGSISLLSSGDSTGSIVLLIEAFIIGLIFWGVFPRSYQVYEDHLRIVLGGPFSINVEFSKIESIRVTSRLILSVNFITRFTKSYVEIKKQKGFSIAITPSDYDSFIENANMALSQWIETNMK